MLTWEQFSDPGFHNAYDVVQGLRSNWMNARGPDSFTSPGKVVVYIDGVRLGGVETLRTIELSPITYIRHFDAAAATARWGVGHTAGVIYVSTHSPGTPGIPLTEMSRPLR